MFVFAQLQFGVVSPAGLLKYIESNIISNIIFFLCFNATIKFIILQHVIVTLIISLTFQNQLPNSLSSTSVELKHGT